MQHKIVNMLDPQSHYNPRPKRSSSSGTLNMLPPWNIHTVKQSMPRSCSNGCSLNWFTPSEFFKFSQLTNELVSLKNGNAVHKQFNLVWVWNWKLNWRSISINPKISGDLNSAKMQFCYKFGNCNLNWWWVMACTSSKWGKFWLWSSIWPWRSWSIIPQNYRALNQGLLHLWSKFGDPSLNGSWVIARTNSWLTDTHTYTHTHAGNDNTRRPKTGLG